MWQSSSCRKKTLWPHPLGSCSATSGKKWEIKIDLFLVVLFMKLRHVITVDKSVHLRSQVYLWRVKVTCVIRDETLLSAQCHSPPALVKRNKHQQFSFSHAEPEKKWSYPPKKTLRDSGRTLQKLQFKITEGSQSYLMVFFRLAYRQISDFWFIDFWWRKKWRICIGP